MKTMKKNLLALGIILMSALTFTACSDDNGNDDGVQPSLSSTNTYIPCAGNYMKNDGTVGLLDYNTGNRPNAPFLYYDAYQAQNGTGIGDAQDLIIVGNKIIVTSTSSSKLEILNRLGKLEHRVKLHNTQPRFLATDGKYVYFSAYTGKVYKVNPNDYKKTIIDSVIVGSHPEALSVANGKLYVNMSDYNYDGTGKSVSVVDLNTFKKIKELQVALNPYDQSYSVDDKVYFASSFHGEDAAVQVIDAKTDQVTTLCKANIFGYDKTKNRLICFSTQYDYTLKRFVVNKAFTYDIATKEQKELNLEGLISPSQVSVDNKGYIYVIDTPKYSEPSRVFYYSPEGKLIQGPILVGYDAHKIKSAN